MMGIAIIPARGGSKGVPRKNLTTVAGVPLIERAVLACGQSRRIDRVVVTSDDPEILSTAEHAGAELIERPAELATDDATRVATIRHAIGTGLQGDFLAIVQCTSPFILPEHIDSCFAALDDHKAVDVAILAARAHTIIWRGGGDRQCCLSHADGEIRYSRQDADAIWFETGACYVYRWAAFIGHEDRIREANTALVPVPSWPYSVDIDNPDDLRLADMLAREWGLW
jgi:CMP-N-acetylneuraminic acid synthetase